MRLQKSRHCSYPPVQVPLTPRFLGGVTMGFGYVSARIHGGKYMADTKTSVANTPIWLDLSSSDAAASRDYYSKLFGWTIDVNPDPQYGGYAVAKLDGKDVA